MKSKIFSSIKNKKINVFLTFLLVSFGILMLTKLSRSYTNTIAFHINHLNVPEEYVIYSSNEKLNISLKTQGFSLLKFYVSKPVIDIDFESNIIKNDSNFIWNSTMGYSKIIAQFDKDIEVININPDTLRFKYDINAIKEVPIKVNSKLNFSLGYDLIDTFVIQPDSIRIIGPERMISEITFVETDTIIMNDVSNDLNVKTPLQFPINSNELKFSISHTNVKASKSLANAKCQCHLRKNHTPTGGFYEHRILSTTRWHKFDYSPRSGRLVSVLGRTQVGIHWALHSLLLPTHVRNYWWVSPLLFSQDIQDLTPIPICARFSRHHRTPKGPFVVGCGSSPPPHPFRPTFRSPLSCCARLLPKPHRLGSKPVLQSHRYEYGEGFEQVSRIKMAR